MFFGNPTNLFSREAMQKNTPLFIILTSEYPPDMYGGIAFWAANLFKTLTGNGCNAVVLTHRNRKHKTSKARSTDKVRYIDGHDWRKFHWLYRMPHLLSLLLTNKNVILLAATWGELEVIRKLKSLFGFRIYCSSHGTDITKHVFPRKERTLQTINSIFNSVDLFIPVSRSLDRLARSISSNLTCKSVILGCNVNTDVFRPEPDPEKKRAKKKKLGIDERFPLILSVGRMIAVKGFRNIIMALPAIRKEVPDVRYMIVAHPQEPEKQLIGHLVRELNLENHVIFHNPVSNNELPALLQTADVFALTSEPVYFPHYQEEGLPRVIPEASACGLPVVVSTTGGLQEAVIDNETGFVVRHGDQETLVQKLITLLTDKERAVEMGRKGRGFVIRNFSDRSMTEKILSIVNTKR